VKKLFVIMGLAIVTSGHAIAAVPSKINAFQEGERLLYTRLVEAYRKNQLADVTRQRQVLEKNYPKSVHLDNAYYLSAMLEFQDGKIGEAMRTFNTVTDRFPQSNKRPAALFGLAMTYKRLGLQPQALRVLHSIVKQYPGSPESQRAWMHLRLEKQTSLKQ
jgi:TolA-binding protein